MARIRGAADREAVRAALANPAFYPARPDRVLTRETHISWVFLAGDRAYKLKKPIVLAFLDYGTPERRAEMCREEVRLNRRLAADIYIGVRSIAAGPEGFELADEQDPRAVDYLVEMRRYDERGTLAAKLESGELAAQEITAVARLLARFHARAQPATHEALRLAVDRRLSENFKELLAIVERRGEAERLESLERFARAFLSARAEVFETRARRGLVRECHGDLRAEHVLLNGPVQIVDCVEFDRGLRELDVADDLAFLAMDLAAHRGERFARMLVQAYRRAGGDAGDDSLIAFYAAYRAVVRAKVALVRAAQHSPLSAAHGHHSAIARDLLSLAERFAWQARLPLVIVICGVPGSGKSHLCQALADRSGLAHLSSDVTRKRVAGIEPGERAPSALYSSDVNRSTYAELGRLAATEASARGGALVDATFRHRADRDAFAERFAGAAPLLFVECRAPASVLAARARVRERSPERVSDASLEIVVRESSSWEPLEEVRPSARVTLRTDRPVQALLSDLACAIDKRPAIVAS